MKKTFVICISSMWNTSFTAMWIPFLATLQWISLYECICYKMSQEEINRNSNHHIKCKKYLNFQSCGNTEVAEFLAYRRMHDQEQDSWISKVMAAKSPMKEGPEGKLPLWNNSIMMNLTASLYLNRNEILFFILTSLKCLTNILDVLVVLTLNIIWLNNWHL